MERKVKVAGIQMSCEIGNKEANVQKTLELIDQAAGQEAQIILLQELFNIEYSCFGRGDAKAFDYAEPIPGPTTDRIAEKAVEHGVYIISPIFELSTSGIYYNTAPLITPTGKVIGKYRKTHIPESIRPEWTSLEKHYFRPGSSLPVFRTDHGILGILICYDRCFPEAWRILTIKGAEIIFVPNALPISKAFPCDYWETTAKARAWDHKTYAVFVNRVGREDRMEFPGDSLIVGPDGDILARAKERRDEVVSAVLDLEKVVKARRDHHYLRDLRVDLYGEMIRPEALP